MLGFLTLWEPSLGLGGMKANLGPFAAADEDLVAGALPLGAAGALAAADLVGLLAGVVLVAAPDAAADVALLATYVSSLLELVY